MKNAFRALSPWLSLCVALAVSTGCASSPPPAAAPTPPPSTEAPAPAQQELKGSPGHVLAQIATNLELNPQQKSTVVAVEGRFVAREEKLKAQHLEHRKALAQSVRDGNLAEEDPEAAIKKFDAVRAETVTDLNLLHATLTPEQRKTVSTEFLAHLDRKEQILRKHHQHTPHRHGDQYAGGPGTSAPHTAAPGAAAPATSASAPPPFAELEASLALTAEQKAKVDAGRKAAPPVAAPAESSSGPENKHAAMEKVKQQLQQLAEAFTQDTFDAGDTLPEAVHGKAMHRHHLEFIGYLKVLVPVLTADQREKVAVHIETWRPHGACGGKCEGGKCDHHGKCDHGGCKDCTGCAHKDGKSCDHKDCDQCPDCAGGKCKHGDCKHGDCKHGDCKHKQSEQTL